MREERKVGEEGRKGWDGKEGRKEGRKEKEQPSIRSWEKRGKK
jgi:hypothetical protein